MDRSRDKPYYSLNRVKTAVRNGGYEIDQEAIKNASDHFGWSINDIERAFLKLQNKHFSSSKKHFTNPGIWVDHYRAENIMGEDVYVHFHFEEDVLIIQSCKRR